MKSGLYKTVSAKYFFLTVCAAVVLCTGVFMYAVSKMAVPTLSQSRDDGLLIIVDAGHGGEDSGTQSADGVLEKDINLAISKKVEAVLNSLGFDTLMIRSEDKMVYENGCKTQREKKISDIRKRFATMKNNPGSIFLSIHQNYYANKICYGAQVFYSKRQPESEKVAYYTQKSISEKLQPDNDRKIKPSGTEIYLLYNAVVPAVMVECGFMSNVEEANNLCNEDYQKKMALAISDGIITYFKNKGV